MQDLFNTVTSWSSLPLVLLTPILFGFAPGFLLRLVVLIYPKEHPRRRELVAELYVLGHVERLLFVGEQMETALAEGVPLRARWLGRHAVRIFKRCWGWYSKDDNAFQAAAWIGLAAGIQDLIYWGNPLVAIGAGGVLAGGHTWAYLRRRRERRASQEQAG